ncbi:MAG: NAD(P)/FAD-dependent oxidoreductase [Sporichthyaceae bacterium]
MAVEQVDAIVVGARCSGTATAIPLARGGRNVVVLDKVAFPSDTLSTHVFVPNGVAELKRMGALEGILALGPARVHHLRIHDGDLVLRERFTPFYGVDFGLCIPRDQQDVVLVEAARKAGADVRERCKVTEVVWRDGRAVGVRYVEGGEEREIHAKVVVGADGRWSRIANEVGEWMPYRASRNGRGFAFRYLDDPMAGTERHDEFGVYRAGRTVALTLPSCPDGRLLVVWMCPAEDIAEFRADAEAAWQRKLDGDPAMAERLRGATSQSSIRKTEDLVAYYRRSSGPGWALVGDAGHHKDPVVGQGMRDAVRHGRLLGEAIARSIDDPHGLDRALRRWERVRDKDTLSTYHWGNRETRPLPTSPLVREVLRTFAQDGDRPDVSDTFNRARSIESIISPVHLAKGLSRALRLPDADRRGILKQVVEELPHEWSARRHRLLDGFRSTRPTSTEHPGWVFKDAPGAPSRRAASPAAPYGPSSAKGTTATPSGRR